MDWNKNLKKTCCDFIFEFHSDIKACDVSSLGVPLNMLIIGVPDQVPGVSDTKQTILMGIWH